MGRFEREGIPRCCLVAKKNLTRAQAGQRKRAGSFNFTLAGFQDMPWYRAMIRGENLFLRLDGEIKCYGFYTTRFVEAPTLVSVGRRAVDRIINEAELRGALLNPQDMPPEFFVEEIVEVDAQNVPESQGAGFTFFPSESDA